MTIGEIWGLSRAGSFSPRMPRRRLGPPADGDLHQQQQRGLPGRRPEIRRPQRFRRREQRRRHDLQPRRPGKIGNTTPRYCYGINVGFNWNGIGLEHVLAGCRPARLVPGQGVFLFLGQYGRSYGFCAAVAGREPPLDGGESEFEGLLAPACAVISPRRPRVSCPRRTTATSRMPRTSA